MTGDNSDEERDLAELPEDVDVADITPDPSVEARSESFEELLRKAVQEVVECVEDDDGDLSDCVSHAVGVHDLSANQKQIKEMAEERLENG